MEKFIITLDDDGGTVRYLVTPSCDQAGKITYNVIVDDQEIQIVGNPNWDQGGALLVPVYIPLTVNPAKVEKVAEKIEATFC